jgi:hypothetical protein
VPITEIGYITRREKVFLVSETQSKKELKPQGWQHFAPINVIPVSSVVSSSTSDQRHSSVSTLRLQTGLK